MNALEEQCLTSLPLLQLHQCCVVNALTPLFSLMLQGVVCHQVQLYHPRLSGGLSPQPLHVPVPFTLCDQSCQFEVYCLIIELLSLLCHCSNVRISYHWVTLALAIVRSGTFPLHCLANGWFVLEKRGIIDSSTDFIPDSTALLYTALALT